MAAVEIIEIKGDASQAIAALKAVGIEADKTQTKAKESNDAIKDGLEALDKRTGGAVSAFKSLQGGIGSAVKAFGTLKGAIIATGLGALLVAVTSLVTYFKNTERGGDALAVVLGALGAVVGKLTDVLVKLGEKLFEAFQNPQQALKDFGKLLKENITNRIEGLLELLPALGKAIGLVLKGQFKEAAKTAADAAGKVALGVENVTDKIGAAGAAAAEFAKTLAAAAKEGARVAGLLNDVEDAERALIVERAKANKQIAEARFVADDLTKSTEERIAAVLKAGALEETVASKEIKNQKLRLSALQAQARISETNEEQLVAIAEAEARVSELEQASIARKRRLGIEVKGLRAEEKAAADEKIKAEEAFAALQEKALSDFDLQQSASLDKAYEMLLTDQEREINAVRDKYFALLQLDELSAEQRLALEEKQSAEIVAITKKTTDAQTALEKAAQDAKAAMVNQSIDAVQGALGALFKNSKAVASANVLIDAAQAAVGIFKNSTSLPEPFGSINRGIQLAALAATTVASIRDINRAQPTGGGSPPSTPTSTPTAPSQPPQFNIVGQGGVNQLAQSIGGQFSQPIRAYVVGGDVTTSQQLQRQRVRTATFG
jgi:molybdopterin converting factor small subunit